jgi:hypothetical protein
MIEELVDACGNVVTVREAVGFPFPTVAIDTEFMCERMTAVLSVDDARKVAAALLKFADEQQKEPMNCATGWPAVG